MLAHHDRDLTPTMFDGLWNGVFNKGRFAWAFQEKLKGRGTGGTSLPLNVTYTYSKYAGWQFNQNDYGELEALPYGGGLIWRKEPPADAAQIPLDQLKTEPFFDRGSGEFSSLFSEDMNTSNAFLMQEERGATNVHRLIAGVIPAMTFAAGSVSLSNTFRNVDMNDDLKPEDWPDRGGPEWKGTNWLHSDIFAMPFLYTNKVYTYIQEQGGLK